MRLELWLKDGPIDRLFEINFLIPKFLRLIDTGKESFAVDPELGRLTPTAPPDYAKDPGCCNNKLFLVCATLNVIAPIPLYCWYRSFKEKRAGNHYKARGLEDKAMSTARIGFTVTIIAAVVLLWLYVTDVI